MDPGIKSFDFMSILVFSEDAWASERTSAIFSEIAWAYFCSHWQLLMGFCLLRRKKKGIKVGLSYIISSSIFYSSPSLGFDA